MPHYKEDFTINDIGPLPEYFQNDLSSETIEKKSVKFLNIEVVCVFIDSNLMDRFQYIFENYDPKSENVYEGIMDSQTYNFFYNTFKEYENIYLLSDGVRYKGVIKMNRNKFNVQPIFNQLGNLVYNVELTLEKDIWYSGMEKE